jgi:hypothetical protein
MAVISNGLKPPVTDRALIGNGLYKPVTDRFNICNGLHLTSITKNSCNGRLRSPLSEVHIGNGRFGGQPRVVLARLWVTGAKQQPLQMWVVVTDVKGPLQMLRELFEIFSRSDFLTVIICHD